MPDLSLEEDCRANGCHCIAGVDEVGRGPLAGPVVAAAVILDHRLPAALAMRIDDSKRLPAARRLEIFAALGECATIAIGAASVGEIARLNILQAAHLAMQRAVKRLARQPDMVLVDGNRSPVFDCSTRPVIGGDGLSLSIAAASIVAKVTRDRLMTLLARRYPGFSWDTNFGYGTRAHQTALDRLGPTPHHRRDFAPVARRLAARLSGPA